MESLPNEIWSMIFGYLDDLSTYHAAQTTRDFRAILHGAKSTRVRIARVRLEKFIAARHRDSQPLDISACVAEVRLILPDFTSPGFVNDAVIMDLGSRWPYYFDAIRIVRLDNRPMLQLKTWGQGRGRERSTYPMVRIRVYFPEELLVIPINAGNHMIYSLTELDNLGRVGMHIFQAHTSSEWVAPINIAMIIVRVDQQNVALCVISQNMDNLPDDF